MATLSNESVCGASFNKFSLLQELSGTDADQSLEVLGSIVLFLVPGPILDKQPRKCDNETGASFKHLFWSHFGSV